MSIYIYTHMFNRQRSLVPGPDLILGPRVGPRPRPGPFGTQAGHPWAPTWGPWIYIYIYIIIYYDISIYSSRPCIVYLLF